MRQDGTVVGKRRARVGGRSLGAARLNGIAGAPDHSKLWVAYAGKLPGGGDRKGGIIELPSF